jgi:hypothetical protein
MANRHVFRIESDGPVGIGTRVYMDDEPLRGVVDVAVHIGVHEANTVTVQFIAEKLEMDVSADLISEIIRAVPEEAVA